MRDSLILILLIVVAIFVALLALAWVVGWSLDWHIWPTKEELLDYETKESDENENHKPNT